MAEFNRRQGWTGWEDEEREVWIHRSVPQVSIRNGFWNRFCGVFAPRADHPRMLPVPVSAANKQQQQDSRGFLHEAWTRRIIGVCIQVSNELGAGFLESVYHHALVIAMQQDGLEAQSKPEIRVVFRGHDVGSFSPDFLVAGRVLLELKAV